MRVLFVTSLKNVGMAGARAEETRLVNAAAGRCEVALCAHSSAEMPGIRHFLLDYPPVEEAGGQIARAVAKFLPNLVHVIGGESQFLRLCNQQISGVPWVLTTHNVPPAEHMFRRLYRSSGTHYAVRNALTWPKALAWRKLLRTGGFSKVVCHSQTVATRLHKAGCPTEKVREIPFGSELPESALHHDPAQSPFPQDAWPKILSVGGFAYPKGQLDAVRMARLLLADFPKMSFCLIGTTRDTRYRHYVEKEIQTLGLSQNVKILRTAPDVVKFAGLRNADLYVQPSHEEGFCIAFMEAAMLAPRLVATDTGAMFEIVEGDGTARIVTPGDAAGLALAARQLLRQDVSPAEVEARRQHLTARYSWDAYFKAHMDLYAQVLSGPRKIAA